MIGKNALINTRFKLFAYVWHLMCTNSRYMSLMNLLRAGVILFFALNISVLSFAQSNEEYAHSQDLIKNVQIFPNPSVDYLHIKFETPIAKTSKLIVHSIIGNEIEVEQEIVDEFEVR